jgi:hypothetical protein
MLMGDSGEAGRGEGGGVVREVGGAEASEEAEGEIEAADEELCREMHRAAGYSEVRDEPEGAGGEGGIDAGDEGVEVGLDEAVEEEVGDDEVVRVFEGNRYCVGVKGSEARGRVGGRCFAALAQELEHGGAGVDCVGVKVRIACEELGEEPAVSVS